RTCASSFIRHSALLALRSFPTRRSSDLHVQLPGLHFETCYYQGIEYCLREGLRRFEPGAQGEHKIARGFLPAPVRSRHWIADPQARPGLRRWCAEEAAAVDRAAAALAERSPFRREAVAR